MPAVTSGLLRCEKGPFRLQDSRYADMIKIMGIAEIILDKRGEVLALAAKRGASNVRVFGSVANGTADQNSDIDFLVDLEQGRSLFDLGGLLMDLQQLFGRKVDVVTENGLHWYIKDRILREARPI